MGQMVDDDLAIDLSVAKFKRRDEAVAETFGAENTARGRAISDNCLPRLTVAIAAYGKSRQAPETAAEGDTVIGAALIKAGHRGGHRGAAWTAVGKLVPKQIATAILSGAIRIAGQMGDDGDCTLRAAVEEIGGNLERECRADWDDRQRENAGHWGIDTLISALPDMFEIVPVARDWAAGERGYDNCLTFGPAAERISDATLWACVRDNPRYVPMLVPPEAWADIQRFGTWGERQSLVRCRRDSPIIDAVLQAMVSGRRDWVNALHRLESVAYRINEPMLQFVQHAQKQSTFEIPRGLDSLWVDEAIYRWRGRKRVLVAARGDRSSSDETMFRTDMLVAKDLADRPFYLPMNFDTRGRIYPLPSFNFTRGDHIRCLFDFAEGKPIGGEGIYWLKVHLANCAAGFDSSKPGQLTFDERVQWVDDRSDVFRTIGRQAFHDHAADEDFLNPVDDRFQFVRACIELYRCDDRPEFMTHLPLLFDATSSGLQHYCAMTRSEDGVHANLVPDDRPRDFYLLLRDQVRDAIAADMERDRVLRGDRISKVRKLRLGRSWRAKLIALRRCSRSTVKRGSMTFFYGVTRYGIRRQLRDDHAFGAKSSDYLGRMILETIKKSFPLPTEAMEFLQNLAALLAKKNKSLAMPMPTGFPWHSRYHHKRKQRRSVKINGRRRTYTVTVGDLPKVDKKRAKNSAAPNFVHGLDAALLQLVALNSPCGIMGIHDCFGALAPDAKLVRQIVLDQIAQMYLHHNVLAEIRDCAAAELADTNVPSIPKPGNLKIEECLNANYIIS